ncbi:MAG: TetR/AcrR family transcriptional regulator [Flavobacteriales bacterium]|nr:TetR/AcrR family transcriptional regulator [Bacteroidota bacterium]MCB9241070.1 TetR/AcrR family transcriptional regulator [Flavobacteriales bacterium]
MHQLFDNLHIDINRNIYVKDPTTSDLGIRIVCESLQMINDQGLEAFTIGKLAKKIGTTESSVYRYFENKHKILIYLMSWYWGYLEYKVVFAMSNLSTDEDRLLNALSAVMDSIEDDEMINFLSLSILRDVVVSESAKAYLTKEVDESNRVGYYAGYKKLVGRLADLVTAINPKFNYAHALISTVIEGFHHQLHFAGHLPALTDTPEGISGLRSFYLSLVLNTTKP